MSASAALQLPLLQAQSKANEYLVELSSSNQPLCGSSEGWGPLSPSRWDLTPCFLDVWISAVALFGIVFGSGAIWYLLRKREPQPVSRNWHYFAKLGVIVALAGTTIAQCALQIDRLPNIWTGDFRFWTSIITLASLAFIFTVQYLEHSRSRVPSGVVLFFWLFFNIAYAVKLRSLVSQGLQNSHLAYLVVFAVSLGLALTEFVLELMVPKKLSPYEALGSQDECPYEYSNVFSILSFDWMTPLMKLGYKQYLTQDDLWNLRKRDTTRTTAEAFNEAWARELDRKRPSLWLALFRAFSGPYFRGTIFKIFSDALQFVQPQLLRLLITFVESYRKGTPQPAIRGVAISLAMFIVSVSQTVCLHQYFQRAFETGMRIRSSLTAAIYGKSMRLSNEGRAAKSSGDIVNHMAVDVTRLQDLCQFGQMLWSAPFQMTLCMISLYQLVGISFLAGIAVMIIMIPVNSLIAKIMKTLQKKQMKNKDARTRLVTEILNNMKSIKLYSWGSAFMSKLNSVRNDRELYTLRQIGTVQAFTNFTWTMTPFLVSCSTFVVFVLTQDAPLTTDLVFPALSLFNLLAFPLAVLPMVITAIVEASVAVGRLTEFFQAEEVQQDAVIKYPAVDNMGEKTVQIQGATFTWNKFESRNTLTDISFSARKGELSCIVGRVGSGKSSLLQAMLGDLWKIKGGVTMRGAAAYVAQTPWIMNASVKENIIFGHSWDPQFYEITIRACALTEDFAALPDGDETEVGERGIALSGGQKARVNLARAVYARADVYLLDDVLSAVDQHVGRHLINEVLGANGLLKSKTRVLATNSIPVLHEADHICMLKEGSIVDEGSYNDIMIKSNSEIANLIRNAQNEQQADEKDSSGSDTLAAESDAEELTNGEEAEEAQEGVADLAPSSANLEPDRNTAVRKASMTSLRRASTASFHGPRGKLSDEEQGEGGLRSKQTKETSEQGKVKWSVYVEYAKYSNLLAVAIYFVTMLSSQAANIGGSVWLKHWAETNSETGDNRDIGMFIGLYFAFGVGAAVLTAIQMLILWIFCSIEASRKLHERMAIAIFRSPMSFFETTPTGRILNRFSNDIYRVDEIIARTFHMLFSNAARSLFTLGLIAVSTPAFVVLILPLGAVYVYVQRYYLRTSRELKRLDSVSRSPIFAHFQESINGISTIRAYRQQKRFSRENEWRVDANQRAYFPSISANRWLAIRLEFLGSVILFSASLFAVISVTTGGDLSAGLVGLAMSYALGITTSLNWIVRQTVEVETNIVSVERVLEYASLPSEAPEVLPNNRPSTNWPAHGAVQLHNYSTRYRQGLDLVLKNINLSIKPREKIGVVGRTGAGKSSLTLSLFRIIEPAEGFISVDDLNTSTIGLLDLRSRLAIIPQDAALFEGTVRDNLDPGHVHDDSELWSVLDHARLKEHVSSMTGQLEAQIHEGGSNLSQGQRQLVSIARALLTPSNILVLDEATAAVDVETDTFLQERMKSTFKDRTIITVAHRINTILDSDRIVVLEKGEIAEFDTPAKLIEQEGLFYKLVKESGLIDGTGKVTGLKS